MNEKKSPELLHSELAAHGLASLGLSVAAEHLDTLCQQAAAGDWSYTRLVAELLAGEVSARHKRAVETNLKFSKFPLLKNLDDFDFSAQPGLDRRLIDELATGRYLSEGRNLIFLGPPGVGKTGYPLVGVGFSLGASCLHDGPPRVFHQCDGAGSSSLQCSCGESPSPRDDEAGSSQSVDPGRSGLLIAGCDASQFAVSGALPPL